VESFNLIDVDGDGIISVHELLSIMQSVGYDLSEEDAEDIFYAVDLDGKMTNCFIIIDGKLKYCIGGPNRNENQKEISKK